MNTNIVRLYKPLKEDLSLISVIDGFYVTWAYINFYQFDKPLPKDIEFDPILIKTKHDPIHLIMEWELAFLAREIALHSKQIPALATQTLKHWKFLATVFKKLQNFENDIWSISGGKDYIFKEFRRISHRQFLWQSKSDAILLLRYYKIYSNPRIEQLIESQLGLSIKSWYKIGGYFIGCFMSNYSLSHKPNIDDPSINQQEINKFLAYVSTDLRTLRIKLEQDLNYDDEFIYKLNPLEYYPVILIGDALYCPVLTFLVWRLTSGIYYDLIGNKNFGHPFGLSFQDYLSEVANTVLYSPKTLVITEAKYNVGKKEKDSVDIIIAQENSALFVEAKTKRIKAKSKSELLSEEAISKDLTLLANEIVKLYSTINDFLAGYYSHYIHSNQHIYPLVVTLEDWFLIGDDFDTLKLMVGEGLKNKGLSESLVKEMPYTICATDAFEYLVQAINIDSIDIVMGNWHIEEKNGHHFLQDLLNRYRNELKPITEYFPNPFDEILS